MNNYLKKLDQGYHIYTVYVHFLFDLSSRHLTFFGLLDWNSINLFLVGRGGSHRDLRSTALLPQEFGDVVDVLSIFGRTVVFDMIHTDGPTFNLIDTIVRNRELAWQKSA